MNRNSDFTSADAFGNPASICSTSLASFGRAHQEGPHILFVAAEQNFLNLPFTVQFQPHPRA